MGQLGGCYQMARPLSPLVRELSNTVLSSQGEPGEAGEPGLPGEGGPPVSVILEEQGDVLSGNIDKTLDQKLHPCLSFPSHEMGVMTLLCQTTAL